MRTSIVCLVVGLGLATHGGARADGGAVEASGEAAVHDGDRVAAKQAAVADALKHCVEQVVGISIKNEFTSEQQETAHDKSSEFYQKLRDSVVQKSEGFIEHYDVLTEAVRDDVVTVRVRAQVYASKVQAEVGKLAELLTAAGNPKLMLVIQEVYSAPNGTTRVNPQSVLASFLEQQLLARGFELRGQETARKAAAGSMQVYDQWTADTATSMQAARNEGADVLVVGRVEVKDQGKGEDSGGMFDALKDQTRVEITTLVRGINTATGEVFSSKPVQMKSWGTSVERAVYRAFRGNGDNIVNQVFGALLDDLKTSCRKMANQGQSYVVQLMNVTSYRQQGQRFMDLLKQISGVSAVNQTSFDGGNLAVDVQCKCSTPELQQRIFEATEKAAVLQSLDVAKVSGKRLSFKL